MLCLHFYQYYTVFTMNIRTQPESISILQISSNERIKMYQSIENISMYNITKHLIFDATKTKTKTVGDRRETTLPFSPIILIFSRVAYLSASLRIKPTNSTHRDAKHVCRCVDYYTLVLLKCLIGFLVLSCELTRIFQIECPRK